MILKRFKSKLSELVVAASIFLGVTLTPNPIQAYSPGTMEDPSIHPLLIQALVDNLPEEVKYQSDVVLEEMQRGSIEEDCPDFMYIRSYNHFTDWQSNTGMFGFPTSIEWALSSELQGGKVPLDKLPEPLHFYYTEKLGEDASYPYGDNSLERIVYVYTHDHKMGVEAGHLMHLIHDLTVPAHVYNVAHPGGIDWLEDLVEGTYVQVALGPSDSYEKWTDKHRNEIMGMLDLHPPPSSSLSIEELMQKLAKTVGQNFYPDTVVVTEDDASRSPEYTKLYPAEEDGRVYLMREFRGNSVHALRKGWWGYYPDLTSMPDYWKNLGALAVEYSTAAVLKIAESSQCAPECPGGYYCSEGNCLPESVDYDVITYEDVYPEDINPEDTNILDSSSCTNGCDYVGQKTCQGNKVKLCTYQEDNYCLEWVAQYSCSSGTFCQEGECVEQCTDECSNNDVKCMGNSVYECTSTGGCLSWNHSFNCNNNQQCQEGQCIDQCISDCSGKECGDDGCGNSCGSCTLEELCKNDTCLAVPQKCTTYDLWDPTVGCPSGYECDPECVDSEGFVIELNLDKGCSDAGCHDKYGWSSSCQIICIKQ